MKKLQSIFIVVLMLMGTLAFAGEIYDDLGSSPKDLKKWSYSQKLTLLENGGPEGDDYAIKIATGIYFFKVDTKLVAGKKIKYTAKIKTENIEKPELGYFGLKFMLTYTTSDGKKVFKENIKADERFGSMDWKDFTVVADIPADVKNVQLCMGIQGVSGTAYFADVDVEVAE